ncbi:hypothetical protein CBS9595_003261 [Malassezia furfur]|nr:hypothetical protein CBS9595_003261 [Malassezia furfur]
MWMRGWNQSSRQALRSVQVHVRRFNTVNLASDAYTKPSERRLEQFRRTAQFLSSLDTADQREVAAMLRVDHSGEIAANTIYEAQADVFGFQGKRQEKNLIVVRHVLIQEMWENERKHLKATSAMLDEYQTRPSALVPLWALAGRVLGGATAMMGEKSAMACTEAVETVIGEHYDDQLAHLDEIGSKLRTKFTGEKVQQLEESLELLRSVLVEFRDDELEHLDTAVEHDAQQAPAHALLSAIVAYGCKGAIEVAKRI